jgi:biopolymer transport protein ExbD
MKKGLPPPAWAKGRAARDEDSEVPGIQLAPLVDVVFLLLIFFLVATTYLDEEKDLTLVLPRAAVADESGPKLERILLNVCSDGTVLLGNVPLDRKGLYRALVEARRENRDVPVILRGDRSASHGDIVGVLSICRRARIRNVAVAVEPERDGGTADERR